MKKKRLIFTLLYCDGAYMLSRNFRLQKVGDAKWINNNYNFKNISFSIDELIVLDVSRQPHSIENFIDSFKIITNNVFVPISVGGWIRSYEDAKKLFENGADKIVINTALYSNPQLVNQIADNYGTQAVVASVDAKKVNGDYRCFINNGLEAIDMEINTYLEHIQNIGVGEIYLNSIDKDGTGQNYDYDLLNIAITNINIPIIAAGGAGKAEHFIECIKHPKIDAVATANLFNFIGNALPQSREFLISNNIPLAKFSML